MDSERTEQVNVERAVFRGIIKAVLVIAVIGVVVAGIVTGCAGQNARVQHDMQVLGVKNK